VWTPSVLKHPYAVVRGSARHAGWPLRELRAEGGYTVHVRLNPTVRYAWNASGLEGALRAE